MKILITGKGAREHSILWALRRHNPGAQIFCAPGNAGIAQIAECVPIAHDDVEELLAFAKRLGPDLTVIGPEAALADGIGNRFREKGFPIVAPIREAARLETSKAWARRFMHRQGIRSPQFSDYTDVAAAIAHVNREGVSNVVIKADGLWEGKGVILPRDAMHAHKTIRNMLVGGYYGEAGRRLLIEERLHGREFSCIGLSDGKTFLPFWPVQDYKRRFNADQGLNTGGMGCYAPVPWISDAAFQEIVSEIMKPAVSGMMREDCTFFGFLYGGLITADDGRVYVIEFNARMGDPEASVIWPLLYSNPLDLLFATVRGELAGVQANWSGQVAVCVVLVSGGYPGAYKKGFPIFGLAEAERLSGALVFHAGTKFGNDGEIVTDGGRVLDVVGLGQSFDEARTKAYEAAELIHFQGKDQRTDIAAGL